MFQVISAVKVDFLRDTPHLLREGRPGHQQLFQPIADIELDQTLAE